jgi:hypothetical protein
MMTTLAPVDAGKTERSSQLAERGNVNPKPRAHFFARRGDEKRPVPKLEMAGRHPSVIQPDTQLTSEVVVTHARAAKRWIRWASPRQHRARPPRQAHEPFDSIRYVATG